MQPGTADSHWLGANLKFLKLLWCGHCPCAWSLWFLRDSLGSRRAQAPSRKASIQSWRQASRKPGRRDLMVFHLWIYLKYEDFEVSYSRNRSSISLTVHHHDLWSCFSFNFLDTSLHYFLQQGLKERHFPQEVKGEEKNVDIPYLPLFVIYSCQD